MLSNGNECCGPSDKMKPSSSAVACNSKSNYRQNRFRMASPHALQTRAPNGACTTWRVRQCEEDWSAALRRPSGKHPPPHARPCRRGARWRTRGVGSVGPKLPSILLRPEGSRRPALRRQARMGVCRIRSPHPARLPGRSSRRSEARLACRAYAWSWWFATWSDGLVVEIGASRSSFWPGLL